MKIISQPETNWTYTHRCSCRSVIEYDIEDFRRIDGGQREGDMLQFSCPVCKNAFYMGLEKVPFHLTHRLRT